MNLGKRRITNAELCDAFVALGFGSVAAFRASGNVVFAAAGEPEEELVARIEAGLGKALGYPVPTFVRGEEELRRIAAHEPFDPAVTTSSEGKMQVSLLAGEPSPGTRRRVLGLASGEDRLALAGRELYWLPSGGIRDSKLDQRKLAELLGPTTMRTKGTIEALARKLRDG